MPRTLILLESNPVVAMDLRQILQECLPGWCLRQMNGFDDVLAQWRPDRGKAGLLVFTMKAEQEKAMNQVEQALDLADRVLAFCDSGSKDVFALRPVRFVTRPFQEGDVVRAIRSLWEGGGEPVPPARGG